MRYNYIQVSYLLKRWEHYEKDRHELEGIEKENATVFFNGLSRLSDEDITILKEKYYDSQDKAKKELVSGQYGVTIPVKDHIIARRRNLNKHQYQKLLRGAEKRLKNEIVVVFKQVYERLQTFQLKLGEMYFKGYIGQGEAKNYVVSKFYGKTFQSPEDDREASELILLGFKKVPVD